MAYTLMNLLIDKKLFDKAVLIRKANVYYACGQLTDEEYTEVMKRINDEM